MLRSHVSHNLKANLSPPEMTLQILIEICSTLRSYSSPQHDIGHDLYLLNNQWYNILNLLSFRGIRSLQNKHKQNPMSLSQPSAFFQVLVDHLQVVPLAPAGVCVCVCVIITIFEWHCFMWDNYIPPLKLTWTLKSRSWKMIFPFLKGGTMSVWGK